MTTKHIIISRTSDEELIRRWMLLQAEQEGLDWEVLDSYEQFLEAGDVPFDAAISALYEWDI